MKFPASSTLYLDADLTRFCYGTLYLLWDILSFLGHLTSSCPLLNSLEGGVLRGGPQ
jgi:hypothetical protein